MSRKHERRRRSPAVAGERTGDTAGELTLESLNDSQRASLARAIDAGDIARFVDAIDAGEHRRIAGPEEVGRVGVLQVNPVELDTAALDAEADRLLHDSPPELTGEAPAPAGQAGELVSNGVGSWIEVTPGLVAAADVLILPQWQLREDEKKNLAGALGDVLDQIFPGGMSDARWAPYVRLVAVSIAIVAVRRDPKTGSLPPLGPMKRAEKPDAADATGAADRKAA